MMICACYIAHDHDDRESVAAVLADLAPTLVPFADVEDLIQLSRQTIIDLVYVPAGDDPSAALALIREARQVVALAVVPVVFACPDPTPETVAEAFNFSIDEFIDRDLSDPMAAARLRLAVARSWRDLDVNPSSRLPGPATIERVIAGKIDAGEEFAICYADIDDFKAYNDYYGYFYGDHTIHMIARILREEVHDHQRDAFVGHIGGDDFVLLVRPGNVRSICEGIIARFDKEVVYEYEPRDRRNRYIIARNRRGISETYPLMTLSIAVIVNHGNRYRQVGEISRRIAELKKFTKTLAGSNYVVERDCPADAADAGVAVDTT